MSDKIHIDEYLCEVMMEREEVALIAKALSDANRIKIIEMLVDGEKCGCEILEKLEVSQPTLSHHMKILTECNLLYSRKNGKWQLYSINAEKFREFKQYIRMISCDKCHID